MSVSATPPCVSDTNPLIAVVLGINCDKNCNNLGNDSTGQEIPLSIKKGIDVNEMVITASSRCLKNRIKNKPIKATLRKNGSINKYTSISLAR